MSARRTVVPPCRVAVLVNPHPYLSLSPTWYLSETTFLKLGLSYRHQVADSSAFSYSVDNKRVFIRSAFLEAHTEVGELFLTGALRVDDHKEFGSHGTYKVSVAYKVERTGTTLKAQYGTGFKAPTLSQLYGYYKSSWGTTVGNPHLEPEESEGWSLGLSQNLLGSRCRVEARYFKNHLWNIVDTYYDASRNVTTYRNEDKAITEGTELGLTFKVTDELSLFGNYTHLRAVSYDSTTGRWEELERRPKETFNLGLNLNLEKLSLSFWAHHYGSRKDTDWSDFRNPRKVTLRSFTTFNCYASYRLNERVDLYLKGINLTDKDYELAYGYNTMGRALFAGLEVSFK
ncbi:MAG: hypothetical protein DSY35_00435 [Desulfurobacterium sp.]|nr:MAG: hypothetical protein DSY35_00435 [Desulfurobacterium sp.]